LSLDSFFDLTGTLGGEFMCEAAAAAVVDAQLDAYNARDIERFLHCYSTEAVIEDGAGTVMMRGHDALRAFYGQAFAQSPQLHCEVRQRIRVGHYVIDEEAISGLQLSGFPTVVHGAAVYRVEGGCIGHVRLLM
jgi:hypothetical protein